MAIDTAELRKARGAFFTPPELARFLTRWGIREADDSVLEPSCGEAALLVAAAERLRHLGGRIDNGQLHGVELHQPSASNAHQLLAEIGATAHIKVDDFFDVKPTRRYSSVLGNPPYVRYQNFAGIARAKGQRAALEEGVRLTGLASSWAAFVVHASRFLKPDGRLGLVLPAELLSVNYAAEVRNYLLDRFASVRLVMFEERVFPGVLEEVVLLLAEGSGGTRTVELHHARDASKLQDVKGLRWITTTVDDDEKWLPGLLPSATLDLYDELVAGQGFTQLADSWGKAGVGAVTGNNRYFTLTAEEVDHLGLSKRELRPISPPGSKHLRGLIFTSSTWDQLVRQGRPAYLFYPGDDPSPEARRYIEEGEREGVDRAYKCRVRSCWWQVPIQPPADLFLTYMNHVSPQLTTNRARVIHLNSIHGVTLKRGLKQLGRDLLPIASINTVTLLGAEVCGRAYGGGLLKLEPREADELPVPSVELVEEAAEELVALRPQLARHLRRGDLLGAAKLVDRVLLSGHLGIKQAEVIKLRRGKKLLFERRNSRGGDARGES